MAADSEETFRCYLDKILGAMNVSSIDYDKLNCIMHDVIYEMYEKASTLKITYGKVYIG